MTERAEFTFTVKESTDGTPSIAAEPTEGTMRGVGRSVVGFDLATGTTLDAAKEIAAYMRKHIRGINFTG